MILFILILKKIKLIINNILIFLINLLKNIKIFLIYYTKKNPNKFIDIPNFNSNTNKILIEIYKFINLFNIYFILIPSICPFKIGFSIIYILCDLINLNIIKIYKIKNLSIFLQYFIFYFNLK
uniref:Uncharacterized protein n=1 Tax=Babesia gibsoni TaxID=33632 RepID=A0A6M8NKT8_BABGI|nr:hypothetical protein [Babesia gibsoni]